MGERVVTAKITTKDTATARDAMDTTKDTVTVMNIATERITTVIPVVLIPTKVTCTIIPTKITRTIETIITKGNTTITRSRTNRLRFWFRAEVTTTTATIQ